MKKNAFTLIELLAVIVILAIIALIAVPIVLNIIEDIKASAEVQSINFYGEAVEQAIARHQLTNPTIIEGAFEVYAEENEPKDGRKIKQKQGDLIINVDYDGNVVCEYIYISKNGSISLSDCEVDGKYVEHEYGDKSQTPDNENQENNKSYANGDIVYYDVKTGKGCKNYHEDNSKTEYNGLEATKTTDNQNSCLKFYAFLDDGSNTVNLISDHNTTATVAWNSSRSNSSGPNEVLTSLYNNTKEWRGTITPSDYKYNHSTRSYTIYYSVAPSGETEPYKARLITAQEIAKITGADVALNWKEESTASKWHYLDGAKGTATKWQTQVVGSDKDIKESEYYWLFDRTYKCTTYGCKVSDSSNYGYWTSSAYASISTHAWHVYTSGYVNYSGYVDSAGKFGVRPVITISKSNI